MSNVGGSAGDGGFQFQAKIIAFVAVHMLAEATLTGLEQDIEGIPIAVAAETNGPGDDIRIELTQPLHFIELQAKKGLRVDSRFDEAIEKIASRHRKICARITPNGLVALRLGDLQGCVDSDYEYGLTKIHRKDNVRRPGWTGETHTRFLPVEKTP